MKDGEMSDSHSESDLLGALRPIEVQAPDVIILKKIRSIIASEHLQSGDAMPTDRVLAEQFDLSRNVVRKVLHSLNLWALRRHVRKAEFHYAKFR
ncbi:MAG: GntR family transcriptional regulator [Rhodobacterales bacterium]